ncbi:hypothetical protein D9M68_893210 [compost metagenome]
MHHEADEGCLFPQMFHQHRQKSVLHITRESDVEGSIAVHWIEIPGAAQGRGDAIQGRRQPSVDFLGPRCGLHHPPCANEQRVIEH